MESSNKSFLSWTLDVSYSNRKTPSSIRTQLKVLCSALVSLLSRTVRTAVPRGDCGSLPHFCHRSVSWWNSWPSRYFRMRDKSKIFQDEGQNRNYCLFILKALVWTLPVTAARAELDSKEVIVSTLKICFCSQTKTAQQWKKKIPQPQTSQIHNLRLKNV